MTTVIKTIFPDGINNIIFNYSYTKPPYLDELKQWLSLRNELTKIMGYQQPLRDFLDIIKDGIFIYEHMCSCGMPYLVVSTININRKFTISHFLCAVCNTQNEINVTVDIIVPYINDHIPTTP